MDNFIELFMKGLLFLCLVGLLLLIVVGIPSCIKQEKEKAQQIKECFFQEKRTKECDYIIWQYELEKGQPRKTHTTTVMPMHVRM